MSQTRLKHLAFPSLIGAFVALAFAYSITIPLGEAADEVPHFAYVEYLVAHHQLPPFEGATMGEARQPPLYYVIGALATFWIPRQDFQPIANPDFALSDTQTPNLLLHTRSEAFPYRDNSLAWHLVRLLSIAIGAVTVWATWRLARVLVPENEWLALGSTAFVALLPSFLFLSASVNNDNLVILLTTLSTLEVVSMARSSLQWRTSALLGIWMGLSVLAKWSGLVVWLFAAVVFIYIAYVSRQWKQVAMHFMISFGVASAIIAPWSFTNLIQYGDPLGFSMALSTTELRQAPMSIGDGIRFTQSMYTSFWGRFGGVVHLEMSPIVYAILGITGIPVALGWTANARDAFRHKLDPNARALFALFCVFWLLLLASFVRWALTFAGTDQVRLIFPGLPLFAIFSIAGMVRFFRARAPRVIGVGIAGFLVLNISVLLFLHSTFSPPPIDLAHQPALGGSAAPAHFGQAIGIVDYRIDQTQVAPGDPLTVQFYWQALSDPLQDYWLLLQLADKDGAVANKDGVPSAGRVTTDWWQTGQVFESRHTLIVPKDTAPGTYTLRIGLHPFGKWDWLPVRRNEMLDLGVIKVR